ncbi:MAG: DUF4241 domain-containing protein [Bacteroidales bacterium]
MKRIISLINSVFSGSENHPEIKEVRKIGTLHVPTGRIVVCDPLAEPETDPLVQDFPKGDFPVYLYFTKNNDIAFAELRFSEKTAEKWQMALLEEEDTDELEENEIFGYVVSSSLGCFMDTKGQEKMLRHEMQLMEEMGDDFLSYYDNYMDNLFYGKGAESELYATVKPFQEEKDNVIVFQAGMGEGFYASYIGFDSQGIPVKLVTDFNIIDD